MNRPLDTAALLACLSLSAVAVGCASEAVRPAVHVRPGAPPPADAMKAFDPTKQSLILELNEGDIVPLDVTIEGDLAQTPPGASVPITVKRHCFVRVDDRGLRFSEDGSSFTETSRVPGKFAFGFGVTPAGTRATLRITTPSH